MHHNFFKMHGAGNDFAIFDARKNAVAFSPKQIVQLADRRHGIGCDQLIIIEPALGETYASSDVFMRIYNPDGSEAQSCGNATRCVAWYLLQRDEKAYAIIATRGGRLFCEKAGDLLVRVDMGKPRLEWRDIPMSEPTDTLEIEGFPEILGKAVAVNMGNPHMVFFHPDIASLPLNEIGPSLEGHRLFPERVNVGFAQILSTKEIRLRVYERGAGETLACGTGACAALVAANRRGLTQGDALVHLPGGTLRVEWRNDTDGHVWMTGPVAHVYEGHIELADL